MDQSPLDRIYEIVAPGKTLTDARTAVADLCDVTRQAVEHWERDGIPGKHVLTLETASKRKVSMRELLEWSLLKRKKAAA